MKHIAMIMILSLLPVGVFADSPNDIVVEATNILDQELKARKEELRNDKQALYMLIDDILLPRFDRRMAAQLVLSRHWRTASDEQKDRFIQAFYTTLVHRYAGGSPGQSTPVLRNPAP